MKAYGKIINVGSGDKVLIEVERIHVDEPLVAGNIKYDYELDQITIDGEFIKLNPREILFLQMMMIRPNSIRTFSDIARMVWNRHPDYSTMASIRTLVSGLRKKAPGINLVAVNKSGYILEVHK